ncbi:MULTISPECIES: hypothetical protein [Pseudomonas]|uniref:hypothetical protein n=1 Tax=Pseudomonas TaxID=286 RepID=UPI000F039110|nr:MULTISPECIES: hypothetical protein [Pseudomonas]MBD8615584.1 hypothetical protein [Pseudomonas putida]MBD8681764.1 hypothetical protein [Pseudomonas sp. CFBP 13719]
MSTKAPAKLETHPAILMRIARISTAGRAEVSELKGGAIGYAEAQVSSGEAPAYYLVGVRDRVEALASERLDYLDSVRPGLASVLTMLSGLPGLILSLLTLLLDGPATWGFGAWITLGTVLVGLGGMQRVLGFGNCWIEIKKRKWRWILGFSAYSALTIAIGFGMATDAGDWSSCSQDPTCALLQGPDY